MATKTQHEGFIFTVYTYSNNIIYGVMVYIVQKRKYVEIWYNNDNIQILCI